MKFVRLDRPAIRKLKPGKTLSEHGITIERLVDGDLYYSINVMVRGQRIHRRVGRESQGVTRTQCEEIIAKARTDARHERLGMPKPGTEKQALPTFTKAAQDYLALMEETAGKNIRVKRGQLRMHLVPFFGSTRLDQITGFQLERYKRDRRDAGLSPGTINRTFATVSHVLHCAVEHGWIDRLPVIVEKSKFKEQNTRITVLGDDEIARLKRAAIEGADPDLWLFIEIGAATGMRHNEIVQIRWADCDLANRRIFIPRAKAGARMQPITETLAATLKHELLQREDREGYIFPARRGRSGKSHIKDFQRQFRRAVIAAGLDPETVTPHVLRHTVVTNLVQGGVDLMTIKAISGHRDLRMVQRYAHVSGPHIDAAIAVLDRKVTR
jgi:integrase